MNFYYINEFHINDIFTLAILLPISLIWNFTVLTFCENKKVAGDKNDQNYLSTTKISIIKSYALLIMTFLLFCYLRSIGKLLCDWLKFFRFLVNRGQSIFTIGCPQQPMVYKCTFVSSSSFFFFFSFAVKCNKVWQLPVLTFAKPYATVLTCY